MCRCCFTQWYKYNGKARASESRESMYALLCRVQPRLDTVKELDRMHGLDWYDYGARWQDAAIGGRWHAMDPLCETYNDVSPYAYCMNNPVKFVDPDGTEVGKPEELMFFLRHPLAASRIGTVVQGQNVINISTNATRLATRGRVLYGSMPKKQEERGSENGAFRHTLWQAQITSEFGADIAKKAGDSHEDNPNINMKQTFFKELNDADKSADLHNNAIGRKIGEANKGAAMNETAKAVLNVFRKEGLYQVKKDGDGYRLFRSKIDVAKAKNLMQIFDKLDKNGFYPSDLMSQPSANTQRYDALQNSLH